MAKKRLSESKLPNATYSKKGGTGKILTDFRVTLNENDVVVILRPIGGGYILLAHDSNAGENVVLTFVPIFA